MAERRNWTRAETLLAFRLYCYTPFGKLHAGNPEIIQLAERLGRTPAAVGMKACNFASLDPLHQTRGVVGLANRSKVEEQIWEEFQQDSAAIADEAEQAHERFHTSDVELTEPADLSIPDGPTEQFRIIRTRRVQRFFRQAVLTSYNHRCAITGLAIPQLLNASHIIPWASPAPGMTKHRADPTNGVCLNALHDRAFDRGLITFDEQYRLLLSPQLVHDNADKYGSMSALLREISGYPLQLPERFAPSREALAYHREHIFLAE